MDSECTGWTGYQNLDIEPCAVGFLEVLGWLDTFWSGLDGLMDMIVGFMRWRKRGIVLDCNGWLIESLDFAMGSLSGTESSK